VARLSPLPTAMMGATNALLSFVVITFMFAMIYKLLPDVTIAWRNVWTGATVTAVLFTIGKTLIGLYLGRSTVASVYGAAGSLIVILLWIYYSAQIVFFGAEFTKVYSRRFEGRPAGPSPRHGAGQAHHELAPPTGPLAVRVDGAAVELDQDARQGQPHAEALRAVSGGPTGLRAQIEDAR
jgi:uncharacterized BrkB/YihY/UPF0761 family membrane protein